MTTPELTLDKVKETAKVRNFRASDFLTDDEIGEVHKSNIKGKVRLGFNQVDSYVAEIIARFGYDTYKAWKYGEIEEIQMTRYLKAEQAREAKERLQLEALILAATAGANRPTKGGHAPKSLQMAIKMLKKEQKKAEGGK